MLYTVSATLDCAFEVEADNPADARAAVESGVEVKTNMQLSGCQAFLSDTPDMTIDEVVDEAGDIHD